MKSLIHGGSNDNPSAVLVGSDCDSMENDTPAPPDPFVLIGEPEFAPDCGNVPPISQCLPGGEFRSRGEC